MIMSKLNVSIVSAFSDTQMSNVMVIVMIAPRAHQQQTVGHFLSFCLVCLGCAFNAGDLDFILNQMKATKKIMLSVTIIPDTTMLSRKNLFMAASTIVTMPKTVIEISFFWSGVVFVMILT
jgi:hypothetical protein